MERLKELVLYLNPDVESGVSSIVKELKLIILRQRVEKTHRMEKSSSYHLVSIPEIVYAMEESLAMDSRFQAKNRPIATIQLGRLAEKYGFRKEMVKVEKGVGLQIGGMSVFEVWKKSNSWLGQWKNRTIKVHLECIEISKKEEDLRKIDILEVQSLQIDVVVMQKRHVMKIVAKEYTCEVSFETIDAAEHCRETILCYAIVVATLKNQVNKVEQYLKMGGNIHRVCRIPKKYLQELPIEEKDYHLLCSFEVAWICKHVDLMKLFKTYVQADRIRGVQLVQAMISNAEYLNNGHAISICDSSARILQWCSKANIALHKVCTVETNTTVLMRICKIGCKHDVQVLLESLKSENDRQQIDMKDYVQTINAHGDSAMALVLKIVRKTVEIATEVNQICKMLLPYADVNQCDRQGNAPLHLSIISHRGHNEQSLELLRLLISEHNAVLKVGDSFGCTVLHLTLLWQYYELARYIVKCLQKKKNMWRTHSGVASVQISRTLHRSASELKSANELEIREQTGQYTVLTLSVHQNQPDICSDLLKLGAFPDEANVQWFEHQQCDSPRSSTAYQDLPLHIAIKAGHLEIAQLLVESGASIDRGDRCGNLPVVLALHHGMYSLALRLANGFAQAQRELYAEYENDNDVASPCRDSTNINTHPALLALQYGQIELACKFLDLYSVDTNSAILQTVLKQRIYITRNAASNNVSGSTRLCIQALDNVFETLVTEEGTHLLNYVALPCMDGLKTFNVPSAKEVTSGQYFNKQPDNLAAIDSESVLHTLARSMEDTLLPLLKFSLKQKNVSLASRNIEGDTLLMLAIKNNWAAAVATILHLTGVALTEIANNLGDFPLHVAVSTMMINISTDVGSLKSLLGARANGLAWDKSGQTPLHVCALLATAENATSCNAIVQCLVDCGYSLDVRNLVGETVLQYAIQTGRHTVVSSLLSGGADLRLKTINSGLSTIEIILKSLTTTPLSQDTVLQFCSKMEHAYGNSIDVITDENSTTFSSLLCDLRNVSNFVLS